VNVPALVTLSRRDLLDQVGRWNRAGRVPDALVDDIDRGLRHVLAL
jgi:hypothetical protein